MTLKQLKLDIVGMGISPALPMDQHLFYLGPEEELAPDEATLGASNIDDAGGAYVVALLQVCLRKKDDGDGHA